MTSLAGKKYKNITPVRDSHNNGNYDDVGERRSIGHCSLSVKMHHIQAMNCENSCSTTYAVKPGPYNRRCRTEISAQRLQAVFVEWNRQRLLSEALQLHGFVLDKPKGSNGNVDDIGIQASSQ